MSVTGTSDLLVKEDFVVMLEPENVPGAHSEGHNYQFRRLLSMAIRVQLSRGTESRRQDLSSPLLQ